MNYSSTIALCLGDCRSSTEPGCVLDLQASVVLENVCWPFDYHMKQREKKNSTKQANKDTSILMGETTYLGLYFFSFFNLNSK